MKKPIGQSELTEIISAFSDKFWCIGRWADGDCDAFAIALCTVLNENGCTADLIRIERTTYEYDDFETTEVDSNNLSHVVVDCLGDTWDIDGDNAFEEWEQGWIDEPNQSTEFGQCPTNEQEIYLIRKAKNEKTNVEVLNRCLAGLRLIADALLTVFVCPTCGK